MDKTSFDTLRNRLLQNEKIFLGFTVLLIIGVVLSIITKSSMSPITGNITIGTSISSSTFFLLGYLNYRVKVGSHDALVELYMSGPPPPKATVVKMIIDNANFKPFKFKI